MCSFVASFSNERMLCALETESSARSELSQLVDLAAEKGPGETK